MSRLFSRRDRLVTGPKASESSLFPKQIKQPHVCVSSKSKSSFLTAQRTGRVKLKLMYCRGGGCAVMLAICPCLPHLTHGPWPCGFVCGLYMCAKWSFFFVIRRGKPLLARWYNYKGCHVRKKFFLFAQKKTKKNPKKYCYVHPTRFQETLRTSVIPVFASSSLILRENRMTGRFL